MDKELLKNTSEKMRKQGHRSTQYPLWVIQVDELSLINEYEDYDVKERKEPEDQEYACKECDTRYEVEGEYPEECDKCDDSCFYLFKKNRVFDLRAGVFFTEEACHAHIEGNSYHYENPKSYVIGAWRNPEMQAVMQELLSKTGGIPNHYK